MEKLFNAWNRVKKWLAGVEKIVFFHGREVWFVRLGKNLGFEQDGKGADFRRPVIILKKINRHCFLAVPLTSREKTGKYYFPVSEIRGRKNTAILSQVRLIDARRLIHRIGVIPKTEFCELKQKIAEMILRDSF